MTWRFFHRDSFVFNFIKNLFKQNFYKTCFPLSPTFQFLPSFPTKKVNNFFPIIKMVIDTR